MKAIEVQARLHHAAGAKEIRALAARHAALALGRRPRRLHREGPAGAAALRRLPALLRSPDGHVPDGHRSRPLRSPVRTASCTTCPASGSGTAARSRRLPAPTRCSRSCRWRPHRGGHRAISWGAARGGRPGFVEETRMATDRDAGPGTRQALHRGRVGRPVGQRHHRRDRRRPPRRSSARSRRAAPRTSIARLRLRATRSSCGRSR